jgi:hypothetical protein
MIQSNHETLKYISCNFKSNIHWLGMVGEIRAAIVSDRVINTLWTLEAHG